MRYSKHLKHFSTTVLLTSQMLLLVNNWVERGIAEETYSWGSELVDEAAAQVLKMESAQIEWNLN